MTVVTRFAPSPTGMLHIGGARTALFNKLYAKGRGGKFLLRIEDTDRARSTPEAVQAIYDGLSWLGLEADEPPVFQHARAERHRAVVHELLARGRAYRDYQPAEELEVERERAKTEGRTYRSPWREQNTPGDPHRPHVIRFKGPLDGETVVDDLVQGVVRFPNAALDDLVLLRTDAAPTYNLAVVVDDHDMGVTHVIRGDDHLNNAARQSLIYQALGWTVPAFAHVPLIHGPDGAKLSKRHGAQAATDFAELGYLPEAVRNYLARLGWSHGDEEIFSDEQAAAWFDIADVNKSPARLDWDKLNHVNAHYLRAADDDRLTGLVAAALEARGEPGDAARVRAALPYVKERAKTVLDLAAETAFARRRRPVPLDAKAQGLLTEESRGRLARLQLALAAEPSWNEPALAAALKSFAEAEGVGLGKIGPPLRAALTGGAPAPDLSKAMAALGREESLGRLDDALSAAQ
jgi:glutamyl-tRNA synthetase